MAKVFTQEEQEKIKGQVVELVRQSGRETLRQLETKTGATRYLMSVLARELVASGDVYNSGYGLFPSEQARKDWQIVICLTVIVTALVTRKDLCEVRIRTGQTEVAVFTAYEPEE
ncbi:DUF977 family protein [Escherichia coli]|nr:DUF977 family protein [Escherichia coli]